MPESPRRGPMFVNARSRRGHVGFQIARKELGDIVTDARMFEHPESLLKSLRAALDDGAKFVVVGGGDGTFSAAARLMEDREVVMGALPLGTGNSFARDLTIDLNVAGACEVIRSGKVAHVDIGCVGNRRFLNVATLGLSSNIALGLDPSLKKVMGRGSYAFSVVKALAKIQPFEVVLEMENETHRFVSMQVVIGNGRLHAGPFPVAPDASINEGFLDIYALATRRKSAFLKMALSMRGGRHVDLDEVKAFRTRSGRLTSLPSQPIIVDGELVHMSPVDFRVLPGAMSVVVPQSFKEDGATK